MFRQFTNSGFDVNITEIIGDLLHFLTCDCDKGSKLMAILH